MRLGKGKLPVIIEQSIVGMRHESRRLLVVSGQTMQAAYPSSGLSADAVVFYEINLIRIKKNVASKDGQVSATSSDVMSEQSFTTGSGTPPRSRAESTNVKEKTKTIGEQLNESKLNEKSKLISRMAKMGQQMLPGMASTEGFSMVTENEDEWERGQEYTATTTSSNASAMQAALLMQQQQNQQLQQQLAMQQQQQQQLAIQQQQQQFAIQQANSLNQPSNNQLALCKKHVFFRFFDCRCLQIELFWHKNLQLSEN